jgi:hypothetical protein
MKYIQNFSRETRRKNRGPPLCRSRWTKENNISMDHTRYECNSHLYTPYAYIWYPLHHNIIVPFISKTLNWPLPLRFSDQNFVCMSQFHMRATCPSQQTSLYTWLV